MSLVNKKPSASLSLNKIKKNIFLVIQFLLLILALAGIIISLLSSFDLFNKALDSSSFKIEDVSNYFNKNTIKTLRKIDQNKNQVLPFEGRSNPFQTY